MAVPTLDHFLTLDAVVASHAEHGGTSDGYQATFCSEKEAYDLLPIGRAAPGVGRKPLNMNANFLDICSRTCCGAANTW